MTRRGHELCLECPVNSECLAYALADPHLLGFWAGTTEQQRERIRHTFRVEQAAPGRLLRGIGL